MNEIRCLKRPTTNYLQRDKQWEKRTTKHFNTEYINQSGHAASVNDFYILDRANNDFDLLIHESLLILRDQSELNSQQSSIPLVLF